MGCRRGLILHNIFPSQSSTSELKGALASFCSVPLVYGWRSEAHN